MREAGPKTRGDGVGTAHAWIRSNVLGLVAIFIALGGTAVAAQVADEQKAQPAKKGKRGPRGPAGLTGPAGPNNVTVVRSAAFVVPGAGANSEYAICPAGQRATGGGVGWITTPGTTETVVESAPTDSGGTFAGTITGDVPDRWFGTAASTGAGGTAHVWAICQ